jgi:hypothetical protein
VGGVQELIIIIIYFILYFEILSKPSLVCELNGRSSAKTGIFSLSPVYLFCPLYLVGKEIHSPSVKRWQLVSIYNKHLSILMFR